MPILFSNPQGANVVSAPPRVVTVYDNLAGCPPSRTSPILSASITVTGPTFFRVFSKIIRFAQGRTDIQGFVQGPAGSNYASNTFITRRLNNTGQNTWDHVVMDYGIYGNLAGTYTFSVTADSPSSWGCGRNHGGMSVLALGVA
jgi:hypothetical protein